MSKSGYLVIFIVPRQQGSLEELIECRWTKIKVITKTNQKKEKNHRSQWKCEAEKSELAKARENAGDQVLYLIGWEIRANFLDQLQSVTKKTNVILDWFWY